MVSALKRLTVEWEKLPSKQVIAIQKPWGPFRVKKPSIQWTRFEISGFFSPTGRNGPWAVPYFSKSSLLNWLGPPNARRQAVPLRRRFYRGGRHTSLWPTGWVDDLIVSQTPTPVEVLQPTWSSLSNTCQRAHRGPLKGTEDSWRTIAQSQPSHSADGTT